MQSPVKVISKPNPKKIGEASCDIASTCSRNRAAKPMILDLDSVAPQQEQEQEQEQNQEQEQEEDSEV